MNFCTSLTFVFVCKYYLKLLPIKEAVTGRRGINLGSEERKRRIKRKKFCFGMLTPAFPVRRRQIQEACLRLLKRKAKKKVIAFYSKFENNLRTKIVCANFLTAFILFYFCWTNSGNCFIFLLCLVLAESVFKVMKISFGFFILSSAKMFTRI